MEKRSARLRWVGFVLPMFAIYALFFIYPVIRTAYYSFTDWNGLTSRFVGLYNFKRLFQDERVITALKNTFLYSGVITVVQNTVGLGLAVLANMKIKNIKLIRLLYFMPAVFSPLVLGYVWKYMLEPNFGVVNTFLDTIGLSMLEQDWLGNPSIGVWMIILYTVWQYAGYSMVIYLAGLQGVDASLIESASIDGANGWSKFKNITFPLIAPSFTLNIVLTLITSMKLFDQIFVLTYGGPGSSTNSMATLVYIAGFSGGQEWGYGTAMSVVLFVIIALFASIVVTKLRSREVEM